jgi:hypothetical protein
MNLRKIKALEKRVNKEAAKALSIVFNKHNRQLTALIQEQLQPGTTLKSFNGMAIIGDKTGRAWGFETEFDKLDYLASLQYRYTFEDGFTVPFYIKRKK